MSRSSIQKVVVAALFVPILFVGGAIGSSASAAPGKTHAVFPGTITMSFPNVSSPQFLVLDLGQDAGIFAKYGLTVNIEVVSAATITAALESGAIQIAIGAAPGVELAYQEGVPVKLIGSYGSHYQGDLIGRPGFTTLQSLEGHTEGSSSLTALSTILPKYAFVLNHVPLSTITFVPTGSNAYGEFIAGDYDGADFSPGNYLQAKAQLPGTSLLFNFTKLSWPSGNIWGYEPWLTTHKSEAVAVLRAINASIVKWEDDPTLADHVIGTIENLTAQTSISADYTTSIVEMNHAPQAIHLPTTHLESFVNKVLRLVGFSTAYNSYAEKGQEWTPTYWDAAFGKS